MLQTDTHVAQNEVPHANGGSTLHDLFALTDEQILEMEPEAQGAAVSGEELPRVAPASLPAGSSASSHAQQRSDPNRGAARSRAVDYRKLSDKQILDL